MERWQGKLVVVTGASAGIGSAVCVAMANAGLRVVGLARRAQLVDKLQSRIKGSGSIISRQCDVSKTEDLKIAFEWIEANFGCVHALVNNAGIFHDGQITEVGDHPLSEAALISIIDVNLKAPILCTKYAVTSMKKHSFDGHIITVNSLAGHYVPFGANFNVYPSTKHGITAFTGSLASELAHFNSNIKTTSISPGLVATHISGLVTASEAPLPCLNPEDIADAVIYALSTPPNVNINELTVSPVSGLRL